MHFMCGCSNTDINIIDIMYLRLSHTYYMFIYHHPGILDGHVIHISSGMFRSTRLKIFIWGFATPARASEPGEHLRSCF